MDSTENGNIQTGNTLKSKQKNYLKTKRMLGKITFKVQKNIRD